MFSILKTWDIKRSRSKKYGAQCTIHPKKNQAIIYLYGKTKEPKAYMLHEYLHIALRALNRMDRRMWKEYLQAEETLVQEICKARIKLLNKNVEDL